MWQGWTKNLYPLAGRTLLSMLVELDVFPLLVLGLLAFYWVPTAIKNEAAIWPLAASLLIVLIGMHARYAAYLARNFYPVAYVQYYVPGASLYKVALIASWWKNTRGLVVWKGRAYPARTQ